jgi:hypothetical protein
VTTVISGTWIVLVVSIVCKCMIKALAVNAEVIAMQTRNSGCNLVEQEPDYNEAYFFEKADELNGIAEACPHD